MANGGDIQTTNGKDWEAFKTLAGKIPGGLEKIITRAVVAVEREAQKEAQKQIYHLPESPSYKRTKLYWQSIIATPAGKKFRRRTLTGGRKRIRLSPSDLPYVLKRAGRAGIYVPYARYIERGRKNPTSMYTQARPIFNTAKRRIINKRTLAKIAKDELRLLSKRST